MYGRPAINKIEQALYKFVSILYKVASIRYKVSSTLNRREETLHKEVGFLSMIAFCLAFIEKNCFSLKS
jgi:hypothetical protein